MCKHHDAEQRGHVGRPEKFRYQTRGGRHGRQEGEPHHRCKGQQDWAGLGRDQENQHGQCTHGIHHRQQRLHAPAAHRPAHGHAADNIEQTEHRQRPACPYRGQAAGGDHPRQVRRQEGDVKAAGEEADAQQPIAGMAKCLVDRFTRAQHLLARGSGLERVAAQQEGSRQAQQHQQTHDLHGRGPAQAHHQRGGNRRQGKLAEGAARVDDARRKATAFGWDQSCRGGHQHSRPRHARPARRQHANGQDQAPGACHVGRNKGTQRDQQRADEEHAPGADLVGHGARERLREPPP